MRFCLQFEQPYLDFRWGLRLRNVYSWSGEPCEVDMEGCASERIRLVSSIKACEWSDLNGILVGIVAYNLRWDEDHVTSSH